MFPGAKTYEDFRKLLEAKDIDVIINGTPDHWHTLVNLAALKAGKDVYSEKPLTLTIDEGNRLGQAVKESKRILQTGSQQRSDAKFRQACELVRNGKIGKVHTVKVGIPNVNFDSPARAHFDPPAELNYGFWLGPAPKRPYNQKRVHYLFRFFWDYS